jgi:hypothetical protein
LSRLNRLDPPVSVLFDRHDASPAIAGAGSQVLTRIFWRRVDVQSVFLAVVFIA